jgi:transposase
MDGTTEPTIAQLLERIAALEARVQELSTENRKLRDQLEEAQRAGFRQAAPFRRRESIKVPNDQKKKPGRPKGHRGAFRAVPSQVDDVVEVPLVDCPNCGEVVTAVTPLEQYIEEIPVIRPRVTRLVTYRGTCRACGEVRSSHALQTSQATGAAKVQLGPRARALGISLHHQYGLPMRRACRVLRNVLGLSLSPGGLAQVIGRTAARVRPSLDRLIQDLRASAAVFADETSWYVGAPQHWLWVFTTPETTVYHVDTSRGRDVVLDMLGPSFEGILVSDCLASYEGLPYRTHKCIAHHQKAISEARARTDTPDPSHLAEWKLFFIMVSSIWQHRQVMGEEEFTRRRMHLGNWLDRLLATPRTQPGDLAIQRRIGKRRDVVLSCLDDPAAEPTNNRAERALRPAVIARKLSCGNRTWHGKEAWETLTSLAATCEQRFHDFVTWLSSCLPLSASVVPIPNAR